MTTIFINIKQLVNVRAENELLRGKALANLPVIDNAYLLIEDGLIKAFGSMEHLQLEVPVLPKVIEDMQGKFVLPCWCDSHTHTVFAGSREGEFLDKLKGLSYAEIAEKGGGILNSAKKLNEASFDDLYDAALARIQEMKLLGTGALEIKSGYGLSVEGELKMLRVIKKLKAHAGIPIKASFLGAHTYPAAYKENKAPYIKLIIEDMLPVIAEEKLADYVDVFCEQNFFSVEDTLTICKAAAAKGLRPKLHVNQLNSIGGIEAGIKLNALSLDHLETLTEEEIKLLGDFKGCATLLPTAAFFLRMPFQPARKLIEAGAAVTLASDFNPGSSPSYNMNFVASLSCIQMKMLPEEVINAATINGAFAMEMEKEVGSITVSKKANLIITKEIPSMPYLFYSFGANHISQVMIDGIFIS